MSNACSSRGKHVQHVSQKQKTAKGTLNVVKGEMIGDLNGAKSN